MSATLGYQLATRWGLSGSASAIVGGTIDSGTEGDVGTGFAIAASANYLPVFETAARPFVSTSLTLGVAGSNPEGDDGERHPLRALDLRLGAMVGKTFFDRLVPFAAARVFAGPVSWTLGDNDVTGSDVYHYTVGAGLLYQVPGRFSLFAEALALGEKSASLGASFAF